MKNALLLASAAFAVTFALAAPPAQALTTKECSAKYQAAKAAGTLNGMKWNEFRKAQCADAAPAAEAPPPPPPPAAEKKEAPPPAEKSAAPAEKTGSPGKVAFLARLHACSADWKTMKAEGKRPAGMKWPQFWHQCDEQKKSQGM
jgi:hypothetical protein